MGLRLAGFEQLSSRLPLLRQNPHRVHEPHQREALHRGRPWEITTRTRRLCRQRTFQGHGQPPHVCIAFAKLCIILEKASKGSCKQVDDLASVGNRGSRTRITSRPCGCCGRQQHCPPGCVC